MKISIILILLSASFGFISNAQDRGCSTPPHNSNIEAKVFTAEGIEKPDEACIQLHSWQTYTTLVNHNENEGSTDTEWVIHIEPGERLVVTSKFASEGVNTYNPNGYITMTSGTLSSFVGGLYYVSYGSCNLYGDIYTAEATDEVEFKINSPTWPNTIKISVKVVEPTLENEPNTDEYLPFLTQIATTNKVIISTESEVAEKIQVYSASGVLVKSIEAYDGEEVELNGLQSGMYIFQANVNGENLVGKYMQY